MISHRYWRGRNAGYCRVKSRQRGQADFGHVSTSGPIIMAGRMLCSDWLGPESHAPWLEKEVEPHQSTCAHLWTNHNGWENVTL